ncbi:hypothetical protein PO883_12320 [Massilia sp. DJPM01]|uniref:hypothetical protein n=1 Tax=Massilia sp. DJPM01 TaxID=3024404 RepID=UPI00259E3057|nr:hypothetical protein [Massilia sp. DJPM01]MDM5177976.1 hypothetical protein [Massilia sp. DJPM01]
MKYILQFLLLVILTYPFDSKNARAAVRKFENPALQFAGTWRVDSYDFHEFKEVPPNIESQLITHAGALPIGQKIRMEWTGLSLMPGNYNSEKMDFDGPIGEVMKMTFLMPLGKNFCKDYWEHLCTDRPINYTVSFMIVDIVKWKGVDRNNKMSWPDVVPVEYRLVDLSKTHNVDAWVARNGDLIFPIYIDGKSKNGSNFGMLGVRLKRER